jgi:hypothetical protein
MTPEVGISARTARTLSPNSADVVVVVIGPP